MERGFAGRLQELERWHWWFRGRRRIVEAVLRRELGGGGVRRIASLGCGPREGWSWLGELCRPPGGMVVGLDADRLHVASGPRTAGEGRAPFVLGRIERTPFASSSFDAVLALDVLEHLADDAAALAEASRLLAPGGVLLVTVPALPALWGRQDAVAHHLRRYTRRSLRAAFAAAGLPRPRIRAFNTLLLPPIAAIRLGRRLFGSEGGGRSDFDDNRPGALNELLARTFAAERHLVGRLPLPLGVSLLATLRGQ